MNNQTFLITQIKSRPIGGNRPSLCKPISQPTTTNKQSHIQHHQACTDFQFFPHRRQQQKNVDIIARGRKRQIRFNPPNYQTI
jgi:hypothetical protein